MAYNVVQSVESQPTFRSNMSPQCSPETSVDFQITAQRCIPEDESKAIRVTGRGGP
jgi:hypothetical protein